MELSCVTDHYQWELSSLNQQQQILSSFEDKFQLPISSSANQNITISSNSGHLNSKSAKPTFICSSMEASCTKSSTGQKIYPKTINWSSSCSSNPEQQIPGLIVPKEEIPMGFFNSHGGLNWSCHLRNSNEQDYLKKNSVGSMRLSEANEHIIAERKRREKLNQRFIALAAIIPGLKKADKASIIGDAIKYVKQLEQTLKSLEDQKGKRTVETAVLVKRSKISADKYNFVGSGYSDGKSSSEESIQTEIEVRTSEKTFRVKIHCERRKGLLVKVLADIEKLHLVISNVSVVPFTGSFLDITITAEMQEEFSMTMKDLVKEINSILCYFN